MISMLFPRSPLCTAAIVFYTCVCIPLGRLKKNGGDAEAHDDDGYHLVGVMFGDKEKEEEICCPICLAEFEAEDAVTRLPRCAHLFHINCIEPWLLRGHLTCPLCRSFVLAPTPYTRNVNNVHSSSTLYLPIFFFFCLFLHLLVA
ncbi:unnamed protein product [Arabidopsis lyrata]|uniref:Zinc finger family protein n=1 Tax=Arabidopsis lyrata subsp. lyrata TaxID=81972 RepID=D7MEW3_ARALL|nr:RING-H2 finger protein ATL18 [Arabidopsis lyrata subsp. lyrata]EFH45093.1 zinc finger family protein [Arabidopsis lyrata subsp. lyrata]CAH8273697.1 unnamed protein product [Arabidopsis lyrata]|eukprot:XP_020872840.1 RING-H2 finger protein ATL18 [Arabidopsis lyrata subsp. lyrata]